MQVSETVLCGKAVMSLVSSLVLSEKLKLEKLNFRVDNSSRPRIIGKDNEAANDSSAIHERSAGSRSQHSRPSSSQYLVKTYIRIYDEVISQACSSAVLKRFHEYYCDPVLAMSAEVSLNHSGSGSSDDLVLNEKCRTFAERDVKIRIGSVILSECQSFEHLLTALCMKRPRLASREMELTILEVVLATDGLRMRRDIVNMKLTFGDTPIIQAVRARNYDVIRLLLRHGADVNEGWLEFQNSLEVLLFSPTQRYISISDVQAIEQCLPLLLTVIERINLSRLEDFERKMYFPLHPNWKDALKAAMRVAWESSSTGVPSLRHLCRCTIRTSVKPASRMFDRLLTLPLPTIIKQYLRLENDTCLVCQI